MLGAFDDKSAARRMPRCSHHLTSKSSVLFRVVRRREQQETRGLLTAFFTRLEGAFFEYSDKVHTDMLGDWLFPCHSLHLGQARCSRCPCFLSKHCACISPSKSKPTVQARTRLCSCRENGEKKLIDWLFVVILFASFSAFSFLKCKVLATGPRS